MRIVYPPPTHQFQEALLEDILAAAAQPIAADEVPQVSNIFYRLWHVRVQTTRLYKIYYYIT